ncbi:MAG: Ig-like domain-containing protein [Bacteroidota bacterium]
MTLTSTATGGTWSSSNTSRATVSSSGVVTGVAYGSVNISYSTESTPHTIFVYSNPIPAISGTAKACVGYTSTLSHSVTGGTWSTTAFSTVVSVNSSTGVVTGLSGGEPLGSTGTIYYTIGGNCTISKPFTVNPLPTAVITGTTTMCTGSSTMLYSGGTTPSWTSNNTAVATVSTPAQTSTPIVGVSAGTANITYTRGNGCYFYTTVTVGAVIAGSSRVCVDQTTTLTATPAGGTWSSSNANASINSTTGVVTGVTAGTATVTYLSGTGCTATLTFTIDPIPATITGTTSVCEGATTSLSNATGGGTWSSSNTGVATVNSSGVVTGVLAGTATISYTLSTGCYKTVTITVNQTPATISGPSTVIDGATITLTNSVSGGTWTSTNTAIATVGSSTGLVTGVDPGTTIISYTLSGGCYATTVVTVNPAAITGMLSVCVGMNTTLASATGGGTWSSSNTGIATIGSANGVVTGIADGTATITYTVSGGYYAVATVTVNANPDAISGISEICNGASATLSDATAGGSWSSSDISNLTVGSMTGIINAVYTGTVSPVYATVTYTLPSGCYATKEISVIQSGYPITINPNSPPNLHDICLGNINIQMAGSAGGGTWSTSNTSVITIASDGRLAAGTTTETTANVILTMPNGCQSFYQFTVHELPTMTGTTSFCFGKSTTLSGSPSGGAWSSTNTSVASVGTGTGIVQYSSGIGTSEVSYRLFQFDKCAVTATVNVTTPYTVSVSGSGDFDLCTSEVVDLDIDATGGTWYSLNSNFTMVGSTGVLTAPSAVPTAPNDRAHIWYVIPGECWGYQQVTVNACSPKLNNGGYLADAATAQAGYTIYPNPAANDITILQEIPVDKPADIKVINAAGSSVYSGQITFVSGRGYLKTDKLTPGLYLVAIQSSDGNTSTQKLTIKK